LQAKTANILDQSVWGFTGCTPPQQLYLHPWLAATEMEARQGDGKQIKHTQLLTPCDFWGDARDKPAGEFGSTSMLQQRSPHCSGVPCSASLLLYHKDVSNKTLPLALF